MNSNFQEKAKNWIGRIYITLLYALTYGLCVLNKHVFLIPFQSVKTPAFLEDSSTQLSFPSWNLWKPPLEWNDLPSLFSQCWLHLFYDISYTISILDFLRSEILSFCLLFSFISHPLSLSSCIVAQVGVSSTNVPDWIDLQMARTSMELRNPLV